MKKGDFRLKNGFTIIEVSLVLAIAGLIFLMVFIALPSLQRGQRDARRREDIMTFLEEVKRFQTNNRGALPSNDAAWIKFYSDYFKSGFGDPSSGYYKQKVVSCGDNVNADANCNNAEIGKVFDSAFPYSDYSFLVVTQATCSGDTPIKTSNPRNVAVLYRLEGAGVYCGNT